MNLIRSWVTNVTSLSGSGGGTTPRLTDYYILQWNQRFSRFRLAKIFIPLGLWVKIFIIKNLRVAMRAFCVCARACGRDLVLEWVSKFI